MKTLVLLFLLSLAPLAYAEKVDLGGTDVGTGGDHIALDSVAWFLGKDRVVKACLTLDPAFGVTPDFALAAAIKAYGKWLAYAEERVETYSSHYWKEFAYPTMRLVEGCRGGEDLEIRLGGAIKKPRNLVQPIAFAQQLSFDQKNKWSKGVVWVDAEPNDFLPWTKPYVLEAVLLHELGHVFGNPHVDNTIMDENIMQQIRENVGMVEAAAEENGIPEKEVVEILSQLTHIDQQKDLIARPLNKTWVADPYDPDQLIGRKLKGKVECSVSEQTSEIYPEAEPYTSGLMAFHCHDEIGPFVMEFHPQSNLSTTAGTKVFRQIYTPNEYVAGKEAYQSKVLVGTLYLPTKTMLAIVETNSGWDTWFSLSSQYIPGEKESFYLWGKREFTLGPNNWSGKP